MWRKHYPPVRVNLVSAEGPVYGMLTGCILKKWNTRAQLVALMLLLFASHHCAEATYLRMDTIYRFQVLAFNDAGEGPMSDIVRMRTQQDGRCGVIPGERISG